MTTYVTATKARKQFFKMIDMASTPGASVTITHAGLPKVVMMSVDEFEGWMETLEIMSDPKLVKDIEEGMKEKETIPWSKIKKKMKL